MRGADRRKVRIERRLRSRQTDAERKLWFAVRDRRLSGLKFIRQEAIGPFIVDFVCRDKRLAARGQCRGRRTGRVPGGRNRDGVLTIILQALLRE